MESTISSRVIISHFIFSLVVTFMLCLIYLSMLKLLAFTVKKSLLEFIHYIFEYQFLLYVILTIYVDVSSMYQGAHPATKRLMMVNCYYPLIKAMGMW